MSKNLENEYKNLVGQENIDFDADALWARIEASLPEKEVQTETHVERNQAEEENQTMKPDTGSVLDYNRVQYAKQEADETLGQMQTEESQNTEGLPVVDITKKRKWYQNRKVFAIAGTLAAACILGIIILPGLPLSHTTNTAVPNSVDVATADECEKEEAAAPAVEADDEVGSFSVNHNIQGEVNGNSAIGNTFGENGIGTRPAGAEIEKWIPEVEEPIEEGEEPILYENVIIKPLEWTDMDLRCEIVRGSGNLPAGEEILLVVEDGAELVEGEEYPCSLRYVEERDGYRVFAIH